MPGMGNKRPLVNFHLTVCIWCDKNIEKEEVEVEEEEV